MKFKELVDFLENKMKMSHIYQPLLIKALVEAGGKSTVRYLANYFAAQDENQILYYEKRIKEMPIKVLKKREVITKNDDLVALNIKKLTLEESSQIKQICEQKIQEFIVSKGLSTWPGSILEPRVVSGSIRYEVLKRANFKCELCGIPSKESPLEVDHILPHSKKGKNELYNFQALCKKCNGGKGNRDDVDFRDKTANHHQKLVRDNIPKIVKAEGRQCKVSRLQSNAYEKALKMKLFEEVREFNANPCAEELADILEVLEAIQSQFKIDKDEVLKIKKEKAESIGRFKDRIFLKFIK